MNKYKNYAISAAAHILENLPENIAAKIDSVILFGSVAQDRAAQESDVDLFFDADLKPTQAKKLRNMLDKNAENFCLSNKALSYKLKGIDNRINIMVGKLDEWGLKRSVIGTGIVLFGRYKSGIEKKQLKQHFIISWETPGKNRGAFLNKLYGYSLKRKRYPGLADKYRCVKIGKSALIVPSEHKDKLINHMQKYGAGYQIMEAFM